MINVWTLLESFLRVSYTLAFTGILLTLREISNSFLQDLGGIPDITRPTHFANLVLEFFGGCLYSLGLFAVIGIICRPSIFHLNTLLASVIVSLFINAREV